MPKSLRNDPGASADRASRESGRTTITLTPLTERVRMCSHMDHHDRKAVGVRTVRNTTLGYLAFYPECAECLERKLPKAFGTTESIRRLD